MTNPLPTDPALTLGNFWEQWHHFGQFGANTISAWPYYTGQGVKIGVIDDGFDYTHPELSPVYRTDLDYDFLDDDTDTLSSTMYVRHGTFVSFILAADDNGSEGLGVAYDSQIVGYRRGFDGEGNLQDSIDAFQRALTQKLDIVNSSWGIQTPFADNKKQDFTGPDTADLINEFENLAQSGRDGLGTNIVFSAGNGRVFGYSANYKNYQNCPYTIAVAATTEEGVHAYFSEAGANILIAAPGDSLRTSSPANDGTGFDVGGTSFSAPIISGIIALMLEANPILGYRDVQEILALSGRKVDADHTGWAGIGWQENGATFLNNGGLHFSHDYGYGLVDARTAVKLAESWHTQQTYTNRAVIEPITSNSSTLISDFSPATSNIVVTEDIEIEHVLIDLDITHLNAGDLVITLISPDGTESVLANRISNGAFATTYGITLGIDFEFSSVAHWGESSQGTWRLRIEDEAALDTGLLNSWSISFIGKELTGNDRYIFTDAYDPQNRQEQMLIDSNGGYDTINVSAISGDAVFNMINGGRINGEIIRFAPETIIEEAILGDGHNIVRGNEADNTIVGGYGYDSLRGEGGNDVLIVGEGESNRAKGGEGDDTLIGGSGRETFQGNEGNDTLIGYGGKDKLYGQDGDDFLDGGDENDFIVGGLGEDEGRGGAGNDKLYGEEDDDLLYGNDGLDFIVGGEGNDTLIGGEGNDKIYGQEGDDVLWGDAGDDFLVGGDGQNLFIIGEGTDRAYGGTEADYFAFTDFDNDLERIYGFTVGVDILNVTDILQGYDPLSDALSDFVRFTRNSSNVTNLSIDADGSGFSRIAVIFEDFGGLDTNDLLANNTLIANETVLDFLP